MGHGIPVPAQVMDPLLWRDAQLMLGRHAEPGYDDRCVWCGFRWPCPARRLAERAAAAARRPQPLPGRDRGRAHPADVGSPSLPERHDWNDAAALPDPVDAGRRYAWHEPDWTGWDSWDSWAEPTEEADGRHDYAGAYRPLPASPVTTPG